MTDKNGIQIGSTVKYLPFGQARASIDVPTDKLFTGQRLDATGLYFYNARYYDPSIGRFISPDTMIQFPRNPQCFNRYSYCLNNPLKYVDPSGHDVTTTIDGKDYTVVWDDNGKYHLLGEDGSVSGSMELKDLIDMAGSYMAEVGDWGEGGNAQTGAVVKLVNNGIPMYFVPPQSEKSIDMANHGGAYTVERGNSFLCWHWGGGVYINYQGYSSMAIELCIVMASAQYKNTEINWTAIAVGAILCAIGGATGAFFLAAYGVEGIYAACALGLIISGGYDAVTGIIAAGICYKIYSMGIEIATQKAIDMPNEFWWPSGPLPPKP
jgi:RHS repeat-associated protein